MKGFGRHIVASIAITAVFAMCAVAIGIAAGPATISDSVKADTISANTLPINQVAVPEVVVPEAAPEAAPEAPQAVESEPEPVAEAPEPEVAPKDPADPQPAAPPASRTPLNPPKDLVGVFTPDSTPYVQLNWDPNNKKVSYFNIYRLVVGDEEKGNVAPIARSRKPEYADKDIKPGLTFRYWVTAVDKAGQESGASNIVEVKTYDNTKPAAPQGVEAVAIDPGVSLDWLPGTDGNLAGYNIYEPKGSSHKWRKINDEPVLDNHYYYRSGAAGDTYAVCAVNFYGVESEYVKVQAVASTPVLYEENDPSITVEGLWVSEGYAGPTNGRIRVAGDAGAKLHFKFKGSQVKMMVAKYWTCGSANVYIDGELVKTINLYSYEATYNVVDVDKPGLKRGEHVLTVEVLGAGNPEGTHNFVNVDAFEVR